MKSVAAGNAVITAKNDSGNEATIAVTVSKTGTITITSIEPYISAAAITSKKLLSAADSSGVKVTGGRVSVTNGYIYLNQYFASGTKVRIEATTTYLSTAKDLSVGFIKGSENTAPATATEIGVFTIGQGANSGKKLGDSSNGWNSGGDSIVGPYTYVCEFTFDGNASVTNKSDHYCYGSTYKKDDAATFKSKTGVSPQALVPSGYAIFGTSRSEATTFSSVKVYTISDETETLVYDSATDDGN